MLGAGSCPERELQTREGLGVRNLMGARTGGCQFRKVPRAMLAGGGEGVAVGLREVVTCSFEAHGSPGLETTHRTLREPLLPALLTCGVFASRALPDPPATKAPRYSMTWIKGGFPGSRPP